MQVTHWLLLASAGGAGAGLRALAVLWLTDRKGKTIGVPAAKVAYVELGSASEERRVGFAR